MSTTLDQDHISYIKVSIREHTTSKHFEYDICDIGVADTFAQPVPEHHHASSPQRSLSTCTVIRHPREIQDAAPVHRHQLSKSAGAANRACWNGRRNPRHISFC